MNKFGSTPLQARANFPFFTAIAIIAVIFGIIVLAGIIYKIYQQYTKSEKYINKQKNRPTNKKDLLKLQKFFNITKEDTEFLFYLSKLIDSNNIYYILKDINSIHDFFRECYNSLILLDDSDKKINNMFKLSYKLENHIAEYKKILSTKQIPVSAVVFYITKEGEKLPFYCAVNNSDFFSVEIPEFFYSKKNKPRNLEKANFIFKPHNGLSYSFSSRVIRYNTDAENKYYMIIAHTENLNVELQRHYKRETIECDALFTPIKITKTDDKPIITTSKYYVGKMMNISGGGCCIKTNLPIKEKQNIGVRIPFFEFEKPLFGIIKKTRRLPDGNFAIHIQFLKYSLKEQNKILAFVYKFAL